MNSVVGNCYLGKLYFFLFFRLGRAGFKVEEMFFFDFILRRFKLFYICSFRVTGKFFWGSGVLIFIGYFSVRGNVYVLL